MSVPIKSSLSRSQVCAFVLVVLVSGCGGGETSAPPPVSAAPAPAPRPVQPAAQANPGAGRPANTVPQNTGQAGTQSTEDPEELPPNTFLLGVESANFVLPTETEPDPSQQFALVRLDSMDQGWTRIDSTQFIREPIDARTQAPRGRGGYQPPEDFTAFDDAPLNEAGLPLGIHCNTDDGFMRLIPGGAYVQGTDQGTPDAAPAHPAIVGPFYMDAYEVTVGQYRQFREAMREARESVPAEPSNLSSPDDHPALGITWRDAQRYAEWAGKALPSEAEWELAARGLDSYPYVWGTTRAVWPSPRTLGQIDPVGYFPTDCSVFGIYDMAGNAREWCQDFYHESAYADAHANDGSPLTNWLGPNRASVSGHRVVRGSNEGWEAWRRGSHHMSEASGDIGFRCVLRIDPQAEPTSPAVSDDDD